MLPSWKEISQNSVAAARIMLGRKESVGELDLSASGFWRSFYALLLELPFAVASNGLDYKQERAAGDIKTATSLANYLVAQISSATLAYLVSLIVILAFATAMKKKQLYPVSVIALNWSGLVLSIVTLPIVFALAYLTGFDQGNASTLLFILSLLLFAVIIVALFRVLRTTLDLGFGPAILVMLLMMVTEMSVYLFILGGFGI